MTSWYKRFFNATALEFWDGIVPREMTEAELTFLHGFLNVPDRGRILDVHSGFGRHAIPLARMGFRVTAVDISRPAVSELKRRAAAADVAVRVVHGDILQAPLGRCYDAAYCMGNSFSYFDAAGMKRLALRISRALKPGGRFAANTAMTAESLFPNFPGPETVSTERMTLRLENRYDLEEGTLVTRYDFDKEERRESKTSLHFIYTVSELLRFLSEAGLRAIGIFAGPEQESFKIGAPQLYLVTEKEKNP